MIKLKAAFIYRVCAFVLAASGLAAGSGFGGGVGKWFFYTVQSNILIAGLFLYLAVRTGINLYQITNADGDDGTNNGGLNIPLLRGVRDARDERIADGVESKITNYNVQITNANENCAVGREPGSTAENNVWQEYGDGARLPPYDTETPSLPIHDSRFTIHSPSPTPHSSLLIPNSPPSAIHPSPCYCPRFQMAATLMITFTLLVFWCLLAPFAHLRDFNLWTYGNLTVHVFTPLAAILDYALFCEPGHLKKRDILLCLILPVANLSLASLLGVCGMVFYTENGVSRHFPYYFMDFHLIGWLAAVFLLCITSVYFLCAVAVYRIDRRRRLSGRRN